MPLSKGQIAYCSAHGSVKAKRLFPVYITVIIVR